MQEIILTTKDNETICTNLYARGKDSVVIVAPGWCMTKDSNAFVEISKMFEKEFDVLSFDFRGHGKSSGFFTFTTKELNDIEAVVEYAKEKGYKKIFLAGFSLGGSIVILHSAIKKDVHKVIAVSAPTDFDKIENYMWKKEAWEETFKKFELKRFLSIRPSIFIRKKLKPIEYVDKITVPTLFVAGEKDPTVLPWHTKTLYEKATCEKEYKLFEGGCHAEDLFLHFKSEFSELCLNWLKD